MAYVFWYQFFLCFFLLNKYVIVKIILCQTSFNAHCLNMSWLMGLITGSKVKIVIWMKKKIHVSKKIKGKYRKHSHFLADKRLLALSSKYCIRNLSLLLKQKVWLEGSSFLTSCLCIFVCRQSISTRQISLVMTGSWTSSFGYSLC